MFTLIDCHCLLHLKQAGEYPLESKGFLTSINRL